MSNNSFLEALMSHYESEAKSRLATLELYLNEPMAVADHTSLFEDMKKLTKELAEAEDALATLRRHFPVN
jgi:hypothetical protein